MKDKIQTIIGSIMLIGLIFGIAYSLYNRNFKDPELIVVKQTSVEAPIKNALFWYETELEKISFGITPQLSAEGSDFTKKLYDTLKASGTVSDQIETMSKKATQKMIELDAYRGTEPNVWKIAQEKGYSHIVMVTIVDARWKRNKLENATYQISIYATGDKALIWEGKIERLAGFFGGMPESDASIAAIKKALKEAKIIE